MGGSTQGSIGGSPFDQLFSGLGRYFQPMGVPNLIGQAGGIQNTMQQALGNQPSPGVTPDVSDIIRQAGQLQASRGAALGGASQAPFGAVPNPASAHYGMNGLGIAGPRQGSK